MTEHSRSSSALVPTEMPAPTSERRSTRPWCSSLSSTSARTVETAVSTPSESRTTQVIAKVLAAFHRWCDHALAARFSQ